MPSNHLILCRPLLLLPSIFPSIRIFSIESVLRIRWPKYWSFSFSVSPCNIQDWFPLGWTGWISLPSKGLKSLLPNHSSKASILPGSAFFFFFFTGVKFLSHLQPFTKHQACQPLFWELSIHKWTKLRSLLVEFTGFDKWRRYNVLYSLLSNPRWGFLTLFWNICDLEPFALKSYKLLAIVYAL